jgi:hypothetical protein
MSTSFIDKRLFTLIASFFSTLGAFSLFSLLSYNMSESDFNSFAIEIRYAGFIASIASMHLGYSLVTFSKEDFFNKFFPSMFWAVFIIAFIFGGIFSILYDEVNGVLIWILSTAVFHIFINSIRVQSNGIANLISIFIKFFALLFLGWISLSSNLLDFYSLYGLVVMFIMVWILIKRGFSLFYFSISKVIVMIKHTSSRMSDEIIRLSFYFIPITYSEYFLGEKAALMLVLILMLVKVFESLMYSVMVHTHILSTNKQIDIEMKYIGKITISLFFISILGALLALYIIDPIVKLWLGKDDLYIAKFVAITILSMPAVLLVNYLKSLYESTSKNSPFLFLNSIIATLFTAIIFLFNPDLYGVVLLFTATFWLRLIIILKKLKVINKSLK